MHQVLVILQKLMKLLPLMHGTLLLRRFRRHVASRCMTLLCACPDCFPHGCLRKTNEPVRQCPQFRMGNFISLTFPYHVVRGEPIRLCLLEALPPPGRTLLRQLVALLIMRRLKRMWTEKLGLNNNWKVTASSLGWCLSFIRWTIAK